jgi:DNA-binding beta-propeller fold protein YncE
MRLPILYSCLLPCLLIGAVISCSKKQNNEPVILPPPTIDYISPTGGPAGTIVTIKGANFGDNINQDTVYFNGVPAIINAVSDSVLSVSPPAQATTGPISITVAGKQVTGPSFLVTTLQYPPLINSVSPLVALAGGTVTITGRFFGTDPSKDTLRFNGVAAVITALQDTLMTVKVPAQGSSGLITLAVSVLKVTGPSFTVAPTLPPPVITGFTPASGAGGTVVTITGMNFGTLLSQDTVWFNGHIAAVGSVAGTTMTAVVPQSAGPGPITVSVSGQKTVSTANFLYTGTQIVSVTTLAGGTSGNVNGTGTAAKFAGVRGCAVDADGNLYVAEITNNDIRMVTPAGVVTTLSGSTAGYADGPASGAKFNAPRGLAVDLDGNLVVAEYGGNRIRKIDLSTGTVSTIAGATNASGGTSGITNGPGAGALFYQPQSVVVDSATGSLYVADYANNAIREVDFDASGNPTVSTLAGGGAAGSADGTGSSASFNGPAGIAIDRSGNLIVSDNITSLIRKVTKAGVVTTIAGNLTSLNTGGYRDGTGTAVYFMNPIGLAVDASGNIIVCDYGNHCIRAIDPSGTVTTFAGMGRSGGTNGIGGSAQNGSANGLALSSKFYQPCGIAIDPKTGNIYISEYGNNDVRMITTTY